jgi:hypothetical protein
VQRARDIVSSWRPLRIQAQKAVARIVDGDQEWTVREEHVPVSMRDVDQEGARRE